MKDLYILVSQENGMIKIYETKEEMFKYSYEFECYYIVPENLTIPIQSLNNLERIDEYLDLNFPRYEINEEDLKK